MTSDAESVPDNPISSLVINASDDDRGDNEFTSDLGNSPVKGKSTAIGSGNRAIGSRGPIGPRPGVFRPCARCRTKKTKCDKVKPTCSNCLKSGSDTPCVYDNDEPLSGITTTSPHDEVPAEDEEEEVKEEEESPTSSSPSKVGTSKQSKIAGKAQHGSSKTLPETIEPIAANRGVSKSQGSHKSASSNQNNNNGNNNGNANNINNETDLPTKATTVMASSISATNGKKSITSSSQSTSPSPNPSDTPIPPVKKIKTGSASSAAIRPSPLRTSVTTTPNTSAKSPSPKSPPLLAESGSSGAKKRKASMSNGSKASSTSQAERGNGTNGRRYVKENDEDQSDSSESDDIVSDLSIKEAEQDQEQDGTSTRPVKREFKFRPPKTSVNPSSKSNGGANGKFIVELTPRQSPSVFVIDKNQKARKWAKSGIAFQTLGGMVSIPLWTSDQEMLLNDPKPLHTQQSIPMMTTGRKDSSLARIAVLSQLDMDMDMDSPERGNTPDSLDGGSPDPTTPPVKRKRGVKKPQSDPKEEHTLQGNGSSKLSAIKKALLNKRARAESGNANVVEDIEGDEDSISTTLATNSTSKASSARSTPAPTQQRPRTFPCSFEGCNKSFMDKFHLDRHEARHVTEEIVCGIDGCTKAYNSISTVRRHQSMMHKDRKLELDAAAAATAAAATTTAAAEVVEAEVEAEAEHTRKNSKSSSKDVQADATTKKTTAKRGKSKSSAPASTAEPEPVKMTLILKDVKDSAYRPWMDSAETSTPLPLRDSKQSGVGISNPKQQN